jgi:hypothetical protein
MDSGQHSSPGVVGASVGDRGAGFQDQGGEKITAPSSELRTRPTVDAGIVIRSRVDRTTLIEYQPSNGTRYVLALTDLSGLSKAAKAAMGFNGTSPTLIQVSLLTGSKGKVVVLEVGPCLPSEDQWADSIFRGLAVSRADAVVLAELLYHLSYDRRVVAPNKEMGT